MITATGGGGGVRGASVAFVIALLSILPAAFVALAFLRRLFLAHAQVTKMSAVNTQAAIKTPPINAAR